MTASVKVKICGITREEDIGHINRYLPDYIGFVFAESRRRITREQACSLSGLLDAGVKKVGVFVNEDPGKVREITEMCKLDVIQLHGEETAEYANGIKGLNVEVWKAVRVKGIESIFRLKDYDVDAFVLDTFASGSYGGTGTVFDWNIAAKASEYGRIVLAGGLGPENVAAALNAAKPFAVDVSSGVETRGFKDGDKIKEFIRTARGGNTIVVCDRK